MSISSLPESCLQRFRPDRELAQGGFGAVWLAHQRELDRPVAIKVLHSQTLEDPTAVQRFVQEARVTAKLTHPNIVVLLDHDVTGGVPWIAYEFIAGPSLRKRVEAGRVPWPEACEICIQVAAALEAAHAEGVLHRDIKPDNVLDAGDGRFKVADFGIARWADGSRTLTAQGVILGTPAYLSPVQLKGEVAGPESDLYALGVMLYELITGQLPFSDENPILVLQRHLMSPVPVASKVVPELPGAVDAVIAKAMSKKREERYQTARDMRIALERLVREHTATAAPQATQAPPHPPGGGSGRYRTMRAPREGVSRSLAATAPTQLPPRLGNIALAAIAAFALFAGLTWWALKPGPALPPGPPQAGVVSVEPVRTRHVAVKLAPGTPIGTVVEARDENELSVASAVHTTANSVLVLGPLASPASISVTARTTDGQTLGDKVVLEPPARAPLLEFAVNAVDDQILLVIGIDTDEGYSVEIRQVTDRAPFRTERVAAGKRRAQVVFPGLKPDTEYELRAEVPRHWGGLGAYRVRTKPPPRSSDRQASLGLSTDDSFGLVTRTIRDNPHPRFAPRLVAWVKAARSARDPDGVLRELAITARDLHDPELGQVLFGTLTPKTRDSVRVPILVAAQYCQVDAATAQLVEFVTRNVTASDPDLELLRGDATQALWHAPTKVPVDTLARSFYAVPSRMQADAANLLVWSDATAAARVFEGWLTEPALRSRSRLLSIAALGIGLLEPATARPLLERVIHFEKLDPVDRQVLRNCAPGSQPEIGDRLMTGPNADAHASIAAWLGGTKAESVLLERLGKSGPERVRALLDLAQLNGTKHSQQFVAALASPEAELVEAAAWACLELRLTGAVEALKAAAMRTRDPDGVVTWVLARLGDRSLATAVARELGELAKIEKRMPDELRARAGMLALAAGEMRLESAAESLNTLRAPRGGDFVIGCVELAASAIKSGSMPRIILALPAHRVLRTGVRLNAGESVSLRSFSPLSVEQLTMLDEDEGFGSQSKLPAQLCAITPERSAWELRSRVDRILSRRDGEVLLSRAKGLIDSDKIHGNGRLGIVVVEP